MSLPRRSLKQELANNQERRLQELDQALQDAERNMLDWSASECKDYKVGIATGACASPNSLKTHKDTGEW